MGHRWSAGGANRGALLRKFLAFCVALAILIPDASALGVNYGKDANDLASPEVVSKLTQATSITSVKLLDANPAVLTALAGTGIEVVIGAGNDEIQPMSGDPSYAAQWVQANVAAYPKTRIEMIALGTEVLSSKYLELIPLLLPAFQNLHAALVSAGYGETVKLSIPCSLDILAKSFPPSHSAFHDVQGQVLGPLLDFFAQTGSPFMVNIRPYLAYATSPAKISLDYALISPSAAAVYDDGSGLYYHNLFDAQVDAIYAAISKLGYNDINVVVGETGWPSGSAGESNEKEAAATVENAQTYNENLIKHLASAVGTPAKPYVTPETFIVALHNENSNLKSGSASESDAGLYNRRFLTGLWYSPPPPATGLYPPPPVTVTYPPPPVTVYYPPPPSVGTQPPPLNPYYPPQAPPVTEPPVAHYPPPPPVIVTIPPPPPPPATSSSPPPVVWPPPIGYSSPPPPVIISTPPPPVIVSWPPPPPTPALPPVSTPPPLAPWPPPAGAWPPPPPVVVTTPPPPPTPALPPISTPPPLAPWPPPAGAWPPPPPIIVPPPPPTPALPPISTPPPLAPWPPPVGVWPPPPPLPWSPPPPVLGPITPPIAPWPPGPPSPPSPPLGPGVSSWCVASPTADPNKLQIALDWACSAGGANCSVLQPGEACYEPNTLVSHASFAFDSYYTINNRSSWDCYFGQTANLTTVDPSYTNCTYP